jgi:uncharacterized protein (TIGR03790 family)
MHRPDPRRCPKQPHTEAGLPAFSSRVGAIFLLSSLAGALSSPASYASPAAGIRPDNLAIVVNTQDPLSVAIGTYYAGKRGIPKANIVKVRFDSRRDEMPSAEFAALERVADRQVRPQVQAYALTWARPYRVGCMSITAAFALGADEKYCAGGCHPTAASPYYNTLVERPYDELRIRPAMSIAAVSFANAKALIDRGLVADGLAPPGDAHRSVLEKRADARSGNFHRRSAGGAFSKIKRVSLKRLIRCFRCPV